MESAESLINRELIKPRTIAKRCWYLRGSKQLVFIFKPDYILPNSFYPVNRKSDFTEVASNQQNNLPSAIMENT